MCHKSKNLCSVFSCSFWFLWACLVLRLGSCHPSLFLSCVGVVLSHLVLCCVVLCVVGVNKLLMQDNVLSPLCFNDTCFLLHHGFDPRLWDDATRRAFVTNAHRRCPSSHCLFKEKAVVLEEVVVEECRNQSQTAPLQQKQSTPTHPISVVMSRRPIECGMQGSIAVSLQDKWVPCMTIDLTDRLADALGKERIYANGEEYYRTEWPIVTGTTFQ